MRTIEQILKDRAAAARDVALAQARVDKANAELAQLNEAIQQAIAA